MTPWYQRASKKAPRASCSVETFLDACLKDLSDPKLRRKIKDNLSAKERVALNDIINSFENLSIRIRKYDKSLRFVIGNLQHEEAGILQELENGVNYTKIDKPDGIISSVQSKINHWAQTNLEEGNISKDICKFITCPEQNRAAIPKPLYKTHKRDANDHFLNPCPIRTIITACGTPVYNLAKLMQVAISHLVSKSNLPKRNGSTYDVLRRIFVANEEKKYLLNDKSMFVFPDIVKMYPSVDVAEAINDICELYSNDMGEL